MEKITLKKFVAAATTALIMVATISPLVVAFPAQAVTMPAPAWNVTGSYVIDQHYNGTDNTVDMTLSQTMDGSGNFTGNGTSGPYAWTITSGNVSGNNLTFTADYTATPDAVTPLTVMTVNATIAPDGTMSGTWSDNYQGGSRTGAWTTTSGNASALSNDDMVTSSTYTVSALSNGAGTITNVPSATSKATFEAALTKDQANQAWNDSSISDPVVSGNTLVVTAQDGATMATYTVTVNAAPSNNPTTVAATNISSTDATLNGMNGSADATDHTFWVSTSPFVTTSTTIPAGVYSTPSLGAVSANAAFSAQLSSVTGMPAVTANTIYYFAAWSNVGGTWYPGAVLNFTTSGTGSSGSGSINGNVVPGNGTLHVDSVTVNKSTSTADGTFAGGWEYVFNITMPNSEPKLSMNFADWINSANNAQTIPVANDMRISSAQADNGGAWITLTGANVYSTPALNMAGDMDPSTMGRQVQVTVDVAVPVGTAAGSYSTTYGVQTTP